MASGPYQEHGVSLQRDALSTPWGFRLQGGKDFKAPLTVQRVFVGSPADGVLHRGDVIVSIENHDCSSMNHRPAQDIIKQAGGVMRMRVRRGSSYVSPRPVISNAPRSLTPGSQLSRGSAGPIPTAGALAFVPKPRPPMPSQSANTPSFGQDYTRGARVNKSTPGHAAPTGAMLSKVQHSLNQAIWQPGMGDEPDYDQRPVHDLRAQFTEPAQQHQYNDPHDQGYQHYAPPPRAQEGSRGFKHIAPPQPTENYVRSPLPNDDNYIEPQRPVRDLKGVFTERPQQAMQRPRTGYQVKHWQPPAQAPDSKPLYQPGWAPKQQHQHQQQQDDPGWAPVRGPEQPYGVARGPQGHAPHQHAPHQHAPHQHAPQQHAHHPQAPQHRQAYEVPRIDEPSTPAWAGSLKAMDGVKPWEVAAAAAAAPHEAAHTRGRRQQPPAQAPVQQQQMPRPQPQMHSPHAQQQMHSPHAQQQMHSPHAQQQMHSPHAQQQMHSPSHEGPRRRTRSPQPEYVPVHQPRVQNMHYAPGHEPEYQQHDPDKHEGDAKVAHLQYNTPLGLYSRSNVEEALTGQTAGRPGEGTMIVTGDGRGVPQAPGQKQFDPKQSSVLRMLQEQEAAPAHHHQVDRDQSARYQDHDAGQEMQYQGYMDHQKQSPSMHALESNMSGVVDVGTSDF